MHLVMDVGCKTKRERLWELITCLTAIVLVDRLVCYVNRVTIHLVFIAVRAIPHCPPA